MTRAQIVKYRVNAIQWAKARRARGLPAGDPERYELHRRVIGRACSSKDFTNREFDAVLGAFLAEIAPEDLNAQLETIEQEEQRVSEFVRRLDILASYAVEKPDLGISYVRGISRKVFGTDHYRNLKSEQLAALQGIVMKHVRRRNSPERVEEILKEAAAWHRKVEGIVADSKARAANPF